MKKVVLLLLFSCIVMDSFSVDSTSYVFGKVYDKNSLQPLPLASVTYGKDQGTIASMEGLYAIKLVPGKYTLGFHYIGYKTVIHELVLFQNDSTEINIGLLQLASEIDQIVISANRSEQKISDITVSMNVIKPSEFSRSHITDAQEIINKSSGIEVMDGQASIRGGSGFSYGAGSRVLALIDGLPILTADAGNIRWQFLPLESLNQIEIIKGASSVLYGSSAINGVINFRTADAGRNPITRLFVETGIYDNPSNKNWIWKNSPVFFSTASFSHLQKLGSNDLGISSTYINDKGYRKNNDEEVARFNLKFKRYNQKFDGLLYGVNFTGGYTDKQDFVLWENAGTGALKQSESTAQRLYGSIIAVDPFISYKKGSFKHDVRSRLQNTKNIFPDGGNNNSESFSLFAEYQNDFRINERFGLNSGFSQYYSKVKSIFYGDHNGVNLSGYSQLELNLDKRTRIITGMRMEFNALDGINDQIVPLFRSGINYKIFDYTFLRASFGQGYRYPSIAEKHAATTLGAVKIFPNPGVKPEKGWSAEIGVKQGIQTKFFSGQADIAFFNSHNNDMIEYLFGIFQDPITGNFELGFRADNVEESRIFGYEVEFLINKVNGRSKHTLQGGYVYIYPAEFNSLTGERTGNYLKYRRKHSARLLFTSELGKLSMGLNFYLKSKILNIDDVFLNELTRESLLPGFYEYWNSKNTSHALMDFNLQLAISSVSTISLAVKNILNTEYMGRPGDIMPQRNFSLRYSASF
jgi:outer membrane cobalamin receptor